MGGRHLRAGAVGYLQLRRGVIRALGVVIALVVLAPVPTQAANPQAWEAFKRIFILPEGRVLDTANNNISHSEGQGYAMLLAVTFDDPATFARVWAWTDRTLRVRDDGLIVWRYDDTLADPTEDRNSAADGDILIAWALARGAWQWGNVEYLREARSLSQAIRRHLIRDLDGKLLLLPGPEGFAFPDRIVLNPSYWVFPAFQDLMVIDPSDVWLRLIDSGVALLRQARFGQTDLPPDWLAITPDASLRLAEEFPTTFGYNNIRIPLYYIWAGFRDRSTLQPIRSLWAGAGRDGTWPMVVDVSNGLVEEASPFQGVDAIVALMDCVLDGRQMPDSIWSPRRDEHYYSVGLLLLAQVAAAERYPRCLAG